MKALPETKKRQKKWLLAAKLSSLPAIIIIR
jgi:hypothetical protein